jgi:hypothetical protein
MKEMSRIQCRDVARKVLSADQAIALIQMGSVNRLDGRDERFHRNRYPKAVPARWRGVSLRRMRAAAASA